MKRIGFARIRELRPDVSESNCWRAFYIGSCDEAPDHLQPSCPCKPEQIIWSNEAPYFALYDFPHVNIDEL